MSTQLERYLAAWPRSYIRDQELYDLYAGQPAGKRYDAVKYALRQGLLLRIRKGLYLIQVPGRQARYDRFELAQLIYGPSYISLESALSFHGWIPEAVYTTTSITLKRTQLFETPIGLFSYQRNRRCIFYTEVERVRNVDSIYLMAKPWKALADMIYVHKKNWQTLDDIYWDLRIEKEDLQNSDLHSLKQVIESYDHKPTKSVLSRILTELTDAN